MLLLLWPARTLAGSPARVPIMPFPPSGRFGWSDAVGPLWFLRERWSAGPRWRPGWARFFAAPKGVALQVHAKKGGFADAGCFVPYDLWLDLSYAQKEDLVMSWVKQVRRPDGANGSGGLVVDAQWVSEYPALHEYLTLGAHPDGSIRRTSTLTLFAEHGSWKLFLNERDSGASLCSTGPCIADTLSALEVMLEAEVTPWRFSERSQEPSGKKGRRGP